MILTRAEQLFPRNLAVVDGDLRWNYAELAGHARTLTAWLGERGVARGDRVAALLPNGVEFVLAYFAAAWLGAILVPLNTRLNTRELDEIRRHAGAQVLLVDPQFAAVVSELRQQDPGLRIVWCDVVGRPAAGGDRLREILRGKATGFVPARLQPHEVMQLYYTSGTTGRAKGVMLTHGNVHAHALSTIAELGLRESDVWAHVAPMFHLADAWATFAVTWVGGVHVMLRRFDPEAALRAFEEHRVTLTNLIPTMLNLMVKHPQARRNHRFPSLRLILSGGAPIAPQVVAELVELFGCEYAQTYGMTETSPYLTMSLLKEWMRKLPAAEQLAWRARTGRPVLGVELRVVDEAGAPVAADGKAVGEIQVRGATVTPGYWQEPELTKAAFADGWLKTGDLAVLDAEGFVHIVDRMKDVINTGGEKVYSTEVESAVYRHPAVLEAAAFPQLDPVWGERVAVAVVCKPGAQLSAEELIGFCRGELSSFKVPSVVRFLEALPRTGSGKISKRMLREG